MSVASQKSDLTNYREKPIEIIQRNDKQEKAANRILFKIKTEDCPPPHRFELQCTGRWLSMLVPRYSEERLMTVMESWKTNDQQCVIIRPKNGKFLTLLSIYIFSLAIVILSNFIFLTKYSWSKLFSPLLFFCFLLPIFVFRVQELTFFGLVEDVIRYATQEGSGRSKQNRRRSVLFTTRDTQPERKVETLPKRGPMAKCQSIQDVHFISSYSTGRVAGVDVVQSVSMSDLNMERAENEIREQPSTEKGSRTTNIQHGHRFLNAIKRYLSLKSSGAGGSHRQNGNKRHSDGPNKSAAIWSPRQVNASSSGVFRPNSARGSTLILIATPDSVTIFGQRNQLEIMLPDFPIEALRSFSSAFIDSKLVYQPDDTSSGGDVDGYSSSSFTSVTSLPKRSSSTSSESTAVGVPTTAHSDLLLRLFQRHIQPLGFNVTVQSHWRSNDTLETHHQWLLHKKHNSKQSIGTSSGRRRHTHAGMASAMSTNTINQQTSVTRRASVLQRLFNKSALTLHTDL